MKMSSLEDYIISWRIQRYVKDKPEIIAGTPRIDLNLSRNKRKTPIPKMNTIK